MVVAYMGRRTSVYLADDLAAAVDKTGLSLAELVRRGIYGPPAAPVVVPLRTQQVPQSPNPDVVPAGVDAVPAAESWRCGNCHHLQAVGSVSHCEFCGAHRSQAVPR